jgi:hypothetical protein
MKAAQNKAKAGLAWYWSQYDNNPKMRTRARTCPHLEPKQSWSQESRLVQGWNIEPIQQSLGTEVGWPKAVEEKPLP